MARPDGRIEPGQKLSTAISARAWNRAQEAADRVLGAGAGATEGGAFQKDKASNVVLVKNLSVQDVPLGGVLTISSPGVGNLPTNAEFGGTSEAAKSLRAMFDQPHFAGILPTLDGPFAIAVEPIAAGKIGKMAIGGCVYFRVRMVNRLHRYASPISGNWTQLKSSGCGPVRILWEEGVTDNRLGENFIAFGVI